MERSHLYHCAELVRQALKCAADSTFDTTTVRPGHSGQRATKGSGGLHVCRDYDKLFTWAEENRFSNSTGSGLEDIVMQSVAHT